MSLRSFIRRIPGAAFLPGVLVCAAAAFSVHAADAHSNGLSTLSTSNTNDRATSAAGIVHRIEFRGLRRIPASTLRAHITSKEGEPLDPKHIQEDVRALDGLGWFEDVSVEIEDIPLLLASADPLAAPLERMLRLVFVVEELPFLAGVEYKGSHVLSSSKLAARLVERRIDLRLAAPVNRNDLWRAARTIEAALADERHPLAKVRVRLEEIPGASAVRARIEIEDGPEVTVRAVTFTGNQAFSQSKLQRQMKHVAPDALLAGLRGKDVYSAQRLDADVQRLEAFYRNNGYPEARVGRPVTAIAPEDIRHWLPWPHKRTEPKFRIAIPVQEGHYYRLSAVDIERIETAPSGSSEETGAGERGEFLLARLNLRADQPFSQEKLERARDSLTRAREFRPPNAPTLAPDVAVAPKFDAEDGTVRVTFRVRPAQTYTVRRIEFRGEKRFNDSYYRKRVLLTEGATFEPERLERGLTQLLRAGFIKRVKPEDVHAQFDDTQHTVDLTIRVEEIGRQRLSLVGGHSGLGSTVGLVYNVFDLLGGEEMITSHFEGGPQSLQILIGVAKESVFGTKVSMGLSLYDNVVRPMLTRRVRLFTSSSAGWGANLSYPLGTDDTLGASYQLAHTGTRYGALVPAGLAGLPSPVVNAHTSSSTIGLNETHQTPRERLLSSIAASGGFLGGNENTVRSTLDYSRILSNARDDQPARHATWAFRGHISGVSSFRGDLPANSRILAGDELVRGAGTGELGPYALSKTQSGDGAPTYQASPAGANLVAAVSGEYRVPVASRAQVSAFFDAGSGWLLPNWLGPDRPALAGGSYNLTAATGVELQWLVPGINQVVRVHYSVNPLRILRSLVIADGDGTAPVVLPHRRRAGLGWALGSFF